MKQIYLIFFIFSFTFLKDVSHATQNTIVANVNTQIISSYEVKNKILTILFLRNEALSQKNIDSTKRQVLLNLIDLKLKEHEINKFKISLLDNDAVDNYLKNLASKYNLNNAGLKKLFESKNLDYDLYVKDVETEFKWKRLIFKMYANKVNINEGEINKELSIAANNKSGIVEYNLAEIEIRYDTKKTKKFQIDEIKNQINAIGFGNAAIKYSIGPSSLDDGNLGWISSQSLSKNILMIIKDLNVGDISEPFMQPNSFLFLKLLDKKKLSLKDSDLKAMKDRILNKKRNDMLNLFSNSHLSKIKNTALIQVQ